MATPVDLAGVIHLHSLHSDGTGTVPEIAQAAAHNGLDFVLLTDHDTLAARDRGEEGWYEFSGRRVLVLVGVEVSPRRQNHYLAFGLERPIEHAGLTPQQIIDTVAEAGGFGFPAHPFSRGSERFRRGGEGMPWRDIDARGYTGIELWSFVTDSAERVNSVRDLVRFIASPERFVDHPPQRNLREWDRLSQARRCVAIGGTDAHQIGLRIRGRVPLRLMAYRRSFRYLRTHLLLPEPLTGNPERDRKTVFDALQSGHAYVSMDSLAPARGFWFGADGEAAPAMGDEAPAGEFRLRALLPAPAQMRLLKNGAEVAVAERATELSHEPDGPGVYRLEAYLTKHGRNRTWIVSNPVYLR